MPPAGSYQRLSAGDRFIQLQDSIARASGADDAELLSVPRIRLVVPPATFASTRYVDASFHVSEDAYVLVVAVDLDRRLRVLYPESPDESGFAQRSDANRLTRFFAGFGGGSAVGYGHYDVRYDIGQRISPFGGGGVLLAIASDRPLQLDRLRDQNGDWDERLLGQLVFEKSLPSAAQSIGHALVLTGQEFNTDFTTFSGRRTLGTYATFASSSFGDCGSRYGYSSFGYDGYDADGLGYGGLPTRFVGFYQRDGIRFARYANYGGGCSAPVYYDVPIYTPILPRPDTTTRDTATTGQRIPRFAGAPRFPSVSGEGSQGTRGFTPRDGHDAARERPVLAAGLRFRPPEQLPSDGAHAGSRMSPRDPSAFPWRRAPGQSAEMQQIRPRDTRGSEPTYSRPADREVRERPAPRSEPRVEPARSEPVRSEPARAEPRSEPAPREPGHQPAAPVNPR